MIGALAFTIIFICYCCTSDSFRSKFAGAQPQAAKWAHSMGMMGYGDSASNIQQVMNDSRMIGMATNPVAGTPPPPSSSPQKVPYYPQINHPREDMLKELKALEAKVAQEYPINHKAYLSKDGSQSSVL
tara:strand:- start:5299 stop:5685 length:387 start_codon:yes stop_codon:yes gene_type:complete